MDKYETHQSRIDYQTLKFRTWAREAERLAAQLVRNGRRPDSSATWRLAQGRAIHHFSVLENHHAELWALCYSNLRRDGFGYNPEGPLRRR